MINNQDSGNNSSLSNIKFTNGAIDSAERARRTKQILNEKTRIALLREKSLYYQILKWVLHPKSSFVRFWVLRQSKNPKSKWSQDGANPAVNKTITTRRTPI